MQSRDSPTWCLGPLRITPSVLVFAPTTTNTYYPPRMDMTLESAPSSTTLGAPKRPRIPPAWSRTPTPRIYPPSLIYSLPTHNVLQPAILSIPPHPAVANSRASLQPCSSSQSTLSLLGMLIVRTKRHPLTSFDATSAAAAQYHAAQRITHCRTLSRVRPALSVCMLVSALIISPSYGRNKRQRSGTLGLDRCSILGIYMEKIPACALHAYCSSRFPHQLDQP
jgi:hypothetical protein